MEFISFRVLIKERLDYQPLFCKGHRRGIFHTHKVDMFVRWFREENAFKGVRPFLPYTRGIWKRRLYSESTLNVFRPHLACVACGSGCTRIQLDSSPFFSRPARLFAVAFGTDVPPATQASPHYKRGIVWTDNKHRWFWMENSVREMTP